VDNPRDRAIARGGRAAAKALGVRYVFTNGDLDGIAWLIAQRVDAVAGEGYDTTMTPILAKVRSAGILLLSSGDDIAARRSVWVNFSNPAAYAQALADALASQIKGRGEYALVRQPGQFPIADEEQGMVAKYVAKTYPNMHLDGTVEGSDVNGQPEPQLVEGYMAAHPKLKGLIAIVPRSEYAAAVAIAEAHKIGKVFSAGNGGGSLTTSFGAPLAPFVRSGATKLVYAGDQTKLGYLTVWAAHYLLTGHRFRPGAYNVGGPIGIVWYHASHQELRLGQPLTITKANVDVYAGRF
jgi:ABC-type sugar transport system substrate-binding protein